MPIETLHCKKLTEQCIIQLAKYCHYALQLAHHNNSRDQWCHINQMLHSGSTNNMVESIKWGDQIISSAEDIADGFNEYFAPLSPNLARTKCAKRPQPQGKSILLSPTTSDGCEIKKYCSSLKTRLQEYTVWNPVF